MFRTKKFESVGPPECPTKTCAHPAPAVSGETWSMSDVEFSDIKLSSTSDSCEKQVTISFYYSVLFCILKWYYNDEHF